MAGPAPATGMLARLLRRQPRRSAVLVGLLALSGVAEGFGLLTLLPLLELALGEGTTGGLAERAALAALDLFGASPTVASLLVLVVVALLLKGFFRWLAMRHVGETMARVARDLRVRLVRALGEARWDHVGAERAGDVATALSRDASWAAQAYRHACAAAAAVLQALVYSVVLVILSWRIGLLALAGAALVAAALGGFVRLARRAGADQTARARSLVSRLLDVVGGMKAIRAMGRAGAFLPVLERQADALEEAERRQVLATESLKAFQEPLLALLLAPAVWLALRVGDVPIATLLLMVLLVHRLLGRAHEAQAEYQGVAGAEAAFRALHAQTLAAEEAREPAGTGGAAPALERGIELAGVAVRYGGRTVFAGVDMEIPARRIVALVGPSGIGKTSLLDLLLGLRAPDEGTITVDGVPLEAIDPFAWRGRIGYVPQSPVLLHDTVAANVALGDAVSGAESERALRAAGAWDFVSRLPDGIDTPVGERGFRLSGGERQRIAVARALLHRPALLVLDEPTSELDAEAEEAFCRTLASLRGQVTVVAASHRPALAGIADVVYELDRTAVALGGPAPASLG